MLFYSWIILFFLSLTHSQLISEIECGFSKSCLRYPTNCSSSQPNCIFFTYQYDSDEDQFWMELSGGNGSGSEYSSIGFTPLPFMQQSDTYFCTGHQMLTAVIQEFHGHPIMDTKPIGIFDVSASTVDGVAVCRFKRKSSSPRDIGNTRLELFDLQHTSYYVIFARGVMESETLPGYHHHGNNRGVTDKKIAFTNKAFRNECGITRGCYSSPNGCIPGVENCKLFSWQYIGARHEFELTIFGHSNSTDLYQSFGFAETQIMEKVDLYYCTKSRVGSAIIDTPRSHPYDVTNDTFNLRNLKFGVHESTLVCQFTRPASTTKTMSGVNVIFDISKTLYFIQHSTGDLRSSNKLGKHHGKDNFGSSVSKINFTINSYPTDEPKDTRSVFIKTHIVLMLVSWVSLVNVGSLFARYYKPLFPTKKLLGAKVWFQVHRVTMCLALLLTTIALVLIFTAFKGYDLLSGAHGVIGLIVSSLAFINVIMSYFRNEKRKLFNWLHFGVAAICRLLAVVTIFLGFGLPIMNHRSLTFGVCGGFLINQIFIEVILEMITKHYDWMSRNCSFFLLTYKDRQKGFNERYLILVYFIVSNSAFLIILICVVITSDILY